MATQQPGSTGGSTLPQNPRIHFGVIGINHSHIYRQVDSVTRGGGELIAFFAKEPDLAEAFAKKYPHARRAASEREILESDEIQLIASSAIPSERAALAIAAMQHGKDFMSDKPGMTTLQQLADVRRVQARTKRIYSILYSERHDNRATVKAGELVKAGAIGRVLHMIGMGPHRLSPKTRPPWFFDKERYGGVLCDLASHQFDQFLYLTGSTKAEIVSAQVGNLAHPDHPGLEDFGEAMVRGDHGSGYIRVTDGFIEVRKNADIGGRPGGEHLFLVDKKETRYIDCKNEALPYGQRLVDDVINRTETAMPQAHCFLAMELALRAQKAAHRVA